MTGRPRHLLGYGLCGLVLVLIALVLRFPAHQLTAWGAAQWAAASHGRCQLRVTGPQRLFPLGVASGAVRVLVDGQEVLWGAALEVRPHPWSPTTVTWRLAGVQCRPPGWGGPYDLGEARGRLVWDHGMVRVEEVRWQGKDCAGRAAGRIDTATGGLDIQGWLAPGPALAGLVAGGAGGQDRIPFAVRGTVARPQLALAAGSSPRPGSGGPP